MDFTIHTQKKADSNQLSTPKIQKAMSTKDFLKNVQVTIIPYGNRQEPVREGVIAETNIKRAIVISMDGQDCQMNFLCKDSKAVMLLRDKRPVIAMDDVTEMPYYIIETAAL